MRSGSISGSASAIVMWKSCCWRAASPMLHEAIRKWGRKFGPDVVGTAPPPRRPALPSLRQHGAAVVPGSGLLSNLSWSGLRRLL